MLHRPDYPKFIDFHQKKAHALQMLGKRREAIDTLKILVPHMPKEDVNALHTLWRQILQQVEELEKETIKQVECV